MAVLNHTYPFYTTSKGHGKHLKLPFAMMQPEREIERVAPDFPGSVV